MLEVKVIEQDSLKLETYEVPSDSKLFEQIAENELEGQESLALAAPTMISTDSCKLIAFSYPVFRTSNVYFYDIETQREIIQVKNAE